MIDIIAYEPRFKEEWNSFIRAAVNGLFLFEREYLEYHADRFEDYSLLFYYRKKLVGVLPLNKQDEVVISHGGLTFGGILYQESMRTSIMLEIFSYLIPYLKAKGITKLIYKAIPAVFYKKISQEDLYGLMAYNATIIKRSLTSALDLNSVPRYSKLRKRCLHKALGSGLKVVETADYAAFMQIVTDLLKNKYSVKPTHTVPEIEYLIKLFPKQIKLLAAYQQGNILGGIMVYEYGQVAHLQYIGISAAGKDQHVLDLLIHQLILEYRSGKKYLNFGVSNEPQNNSLNKTLLQNKESYGARAVVQDTYELSLL